MYAARVIENLMTLASRGESIGEQNVRYVLQLVREGREEQIHHLAADVLCITAKGKPIKAKTLGQKKYIEAIQNNVVTLGIGPAGTRVWQPRHARQLPSRDRGRCRDRPHGPARPREDHGHGRPRPAACEHGGVRPISSGTARVRLTIPEDVDPGAVTGASDELLRAIEALSDADVTLRGDTVSIAGDPAEVELLTRVFQQLFAAAREGDRLRADDVERLIGSLRREDARALRSHDDVLLTYHGKAIRAKTPGQRRYIEGIRNNTVTFCLGPAGTGKTYLAVAAAVAAFREKQVNRIILTRPAVEAGERLGFLPGDLQSKVDPYLRPLYDALFDMLGPDTYQKYLERGNIEVAPLAYMRGRTLDDSFIILDEAQNTSREQMKMFLTRLGFGSKIVITGDITQIDLPADKVSGLREAMRVLKGVEDIAICRLGESDVVRHALVQRIIKAQIDLPADKVSGLREAMRVLKGVEDIAICRLGESDVVRHALVQRIIKAYEVDEDRKGGGKKERRG